MVVAVLSYVGCALGCGCGLRLATQLHGILRERSGFRRLRKWAGCRSLGRGLRGGQGSTGVSRTVNGNAHGRAIGTRGCGFSLQEWSE